MKKLSVLLLLLVLLSLASMPLLARPPQAPPIKPPQAPPVMDEPSCCDAVKGCLCDCSVSRICTCGDHCACPACAEQTRRGIPFPPATAAPSVATYRSTMRTQPYYPMFAPAPAFRTFAPSFGGAMRQHCPPGG